MRKVLLLLGALCVGLIIAELICRQFARDPWAEPGETDANWRVEGLVADPDVGYSFQPGYAGRMTLAGEYDVPFHINSQGLRDDHDFAPQHPGVTRILLVGDSFVFGVGVALPDTLGEQLEKALKRHPRSLQPVEVVAAGAPGYGLDDYARLIERWVPRLHPDHVVVALFAGNDLVDYELKQADPRVVIEGHLLGQRQAWSYGIRKYSVLANLLLQRFNPYQRLELARPKQPKSWHLNHIYDTLQPWLARIAAAPGPDGPPVAAMILYGRDNVTSMRETNLGFVIKPLPRVLTELRRLGVSILDPKPAWRGSTRPLETLFFARDAHHTPAGNRFLATWLALELHQNFPARYRRTPGASR